MKLNPVASIIAVRTVQATVLGGLLHWGLHWPLIGPFALGLFLTPVLCLYFVYVFVAPLTWGQPILARLPGMPNAVALTFDDGPSPETTPHILEILRSEGVHATFFVLGKSAVRHPELVCRIVSEGHAIGIHAFHHEPFVLKTTGAIRREITQTTDAVRSACPEAVLISWLRPPHGFKSLSLVWSLRRFGCRLAVWSVDSRDYRDSDPQRIAARVLERAVGGSVILLHDGPQNAATVKALRPLLHGLREKGLATVCLPEH